MAIVLVVNSVNVNDNKGLEVTFQSQFSHRVPRVKAVAEHKTVPTIIDERPRSGNLTTKIVVRVSREVDWCEESI